MALNLRLVSFKCPGGAAVVKNIILAVQTLSVLSMLRKHREMLEKQGNEQFPCVNLGDISIEHVEDEVQ